MEEIWKPIEGFPGYDVSNMGRIRSYWLKGRRGGLSEQLQSIRLTQVNSEGYSIISLKKNGGSNCAVNVHYLVATAFLGSRPPGLEICHNDGNKQNNAVSNLRYDTPSNNQFDAIRHGSRDGSKRRTILTIVASTIWRPIESQ